MTTVRRFTTDDLFNGGNVNLDHYTENFYLPFYLEYLAKWPEYCSTQESPSGKVIGYVFGKVEGLGERYPWHGHVTAVTVAPEFRRLGMAHALMDLLERVSEEIHAAYFVDLFVRESNAVALQMYGRLGYSQFRRVIGYYTGAHAEDAWDMRKALARDPKGVTSAPVDPITSDQLEFA